MRIDEVCPDCGAERPSWHGGPHHIYLVGLKEPRTARRCYDGKSPEQAWQSWRAGDRAIRGNLSSEYFHA